MVKNSADKAASPVQQMQEALEQFRQEVKSLVDLKLKKAVVLGKLLPRLDELNSLGFPQEKLVEEMNQVGLTMSLGYFKTAIWRLRKEAEASSKGSE